MSDMTELPEETLSYRSEAPMLPEPPVNEPQEEAEYVMRDGEGNKLFRALATNN